MNKFSFQFLFCFNNTIKPKPAFTHKPATSALNASPPSKNNCVSTTLEAQFGIKPMITAKIGCQYLLVFKNACKLSCPTQMSVIKPNKMFISNIKPPILRQCNNGCAQSNDLVSMSWWQQPCSAKCDVSPSCGSCTGILCLKINLYNPMAE